MVSWPHVHNLVTGQTWLVSLVNRSHLPHDLSLGKQGVPTVNALHASQVWKLHCRDRFNTVPTLLDFTVIPMSNQSTLLYSTASEGVIHPLELEALVALIVQQLVVVVVLLLGRFRHLSHQIGRLRLFNLGIYADLRLVLRQVAWRWLGWLGI